MTTASKKELVMYATPAQFREYLRSEYRKRMSFQQYLVMLAAF